MKIFELLQFSATASVLVWVLVWFRLRTGQLVAGCVWVSVTVTVFPGTYLPSASTVAIKC